MVAVGLSPVALDLVVVRGDDLVLTFSDPTTTIFATGDTYAATLRQSEDDTSPTPVSFSIDTSGLASGLLVISIAKTVTATFTSGTNGLFPGVWDLVRTRSTKDRTLYKGSTSLVLDVTHA